ncbi:probable sulfate transporter 4.2 [Phoenix dactylifera]|uniref:Probable sulfate transporter 4.2 n=1 Tax=Phoenix dactylifera TaxID=42345 RepID=A0A8B8ZMM7_PHODC|nr:probable sulfate transporter 4.2 [Phoenix dactylifera]
MKELSLFELMHQSILQMLVTSGTGYKNIKTQYGLEAEKVYFVIIKVWIAAVPYIDCSAVQALKDLHQEYKSQEIQIAISNPN